MDVIETAKAAIRARGHKPNPYRVGREMGHAYAEVFAAWQASAKASRNWTDGRPPVPTNPYSNTVSKRQWHDGYRVSLDQFEQARRKGGVA